MAVTGTKALEAWTKTITSGYKNVNILNMTTSWRNGLGFCAIIHSFHPELIDFDSLDPDDVLGNNSLAFNVAEQQLGIPSLLDPLDMVECELLDRLSILTYLSQYYQVLTSNQHVKNVGSSPVHVKPEAINRSGKSECCVICHKPVFILERLNVTGKTFHRTCFKCARCEEQLTLASFYETENSEFCCEICPDEEDVERERTLKARKDLAKLMEDDQDDTEDETNSNFDSMSEHSSANNSFQSAQIDNEITSNKSETPLPLSVEEDNSKVVNHSDCSVPVITINEPGDFVAENLSISGTVIREDVINSNTSDESKSECLAVKVEEETNYVDSNPFGDDEDNEDNEPDQEPSRDVNIIVSSEASDNKEVSSNPFGEFDSEEEDTSSTTIPSNNPIQSTVNDSAGQNPFGDFSDEEEAKPSHSPSPSVSGNIRKKRQAPKPPSLTVTPVASPRKSLVENVKSKKEADNINRKNEMMNQSTPDMNQLRQDKAEEGQWRKKKGPAPARPLPPKRAVKKLPRKAINQELFDIEVKQVNLEKQGVKLEKSIREICAADDAKENAGRDSLGPEAEDLIIQLFDLVNEKNELFRRQTELIYMKKENRLEEVHADLEYQIRVIMNKPDCQRTDDDKVMEERLIEKLVEVVHQRNFIVDCLEMDRRRELDEDNALEDHLSNYAAVKPEEEKPKIALMKLLKRKKKKKKYKDDEKDVDTSEMKDGGMEKEKKKSSKKKLLSLTTKKLNTLNMTLKKQ